MCRQILIVLLVSALLHSILCQSLQAKQTLEAQVGRLATPYVDNEIVVGMTIGVMHKGKSSIFNYGRLSADDSRHPEGDTIYEIGSVSKVFTGVLLADAVSQGRVKLDQSAGDLLPSEVTMPSHDGQAITLQNLSTHVSGLPRLPDNLKIEAPGNPYAAYTVKNMYAFLSGHKLSRAPGEKSEYSNLGVGLLGQLLAREADTTYEQLLRDRIAKPLDMADTTISLNEQQQSRLAPPHLGVGQASSNWDLSALAGAGAIRSTGKDMLKFVQANLDPPAGEIGKAIQFAWQIHQQPLEQGQFAMGLGWHVAHDGQTRWHNGQTGGYHSAMYVNRQLEVGVVLLTNTSTGEVDPLAEQIVKMLSGAKVEPRKFEKPVAVDPDILERYVGKYQLVPGMEFTVTTKKGKLFVGLTDQPTIEVYPRSETEWYYKVVKATLAFEVDGDGKCNAVELFQHGVRQKAKRIK